MYRITTLLIVVLSLCFALPATGQAPNEQPTGTKITLAKLVAVRNLRCDALTRGKNARLKADIHRAELTGALGPQKINVETKVSRAEADSGAAFEEAGSLKRRLLGMAERYTADLRLQWYQTPDEAERVRLEDLIHGSKEIVDEPCG